MELKPKHMWLLGIDFLTDQVTTTVAFEGSQMNQSPPARIFSTIQNEGSEGLPPHSFPSAKVTSCRNLIHSGVRGWQLVLGLNTKTVDSLVHQSTRGKTQNQADSQNNSQQSSATIQIKTFCKPKQIDGRPPIGAATLLPSTKVSNEC